MICLDLAARKNFKEKCQCVYIVQRVAAMLEELRVLEALHYILSTSLRYVCKTCTTITLGVKHECTTLYTACTHVVLYRGVRRRSRIWFWWYMNFQRIISAILVPWLASTSTLSWISILCVIVACNAAIDDRIDLVFIRNEIASTIE